MRNLFHFLAIAVVVALAFWAYDENYRTQAALDEVQDLHRQIGQARSRLGVLNAEWAYLNRPDRLRALVDMNYERLELLDLSAEQFGRIDQVPYPPQVPLQLTDAVDVIDREAATSETPTNGEVGQ